MEISKISDNAPFNLHRISDLPTYYADSILSNSQLGRILPILDCSLNHVTAIVPMHGVSWQCSNTKHIRGISTFAPLNDQVNRAVHALFEEKQCPLSCFVAPAMTEIPKAKFLNDRCLHAREGKVAVAEHVLQINYSYLVEKIKISKKRNEMSNLL